MLVPPLRAQPPYQRSGSASPREAAGAEPAPSAWPADAVPTPDETALLEREQAFDTHVRLRAEAERESNALRNLWLQQMKQDDEFLRRCIELI